jgi:hypothetical protein
VIEETLRRAGRREVASVSEFVERFHGPTYRVSCRATFDPDERREWTQRILWQIVRDGADGAYAGLDDDALSDRIRLRVICFILERYRERTAPERFREASVDPLTLARGARLAGSEPLRPDEEQRVAERFATDALLAADRRALLSFDRAFQTGHLTPYESDAEAESRHSLAELLQRGGVPAETAPPQHRRGAWSLSGPRATGKRIGILERVRRWFMPPPD